MAANGDECSMMGGVELQLYQAACGTEDVKPRWRHDLKRQRCTTKRAIQSHNVVRNSISSIQILFFSHEIFRNPNSSYSSQNVSKSQNPQPQSEFFSIRVWQKL